MEGSKEGEKHSKDTELPTTTGGQRVSLKGLLRIKALLGLILNKIIKKKQTKKKQRNYIIHRICLNVPGQIEAFLSFYVRNPHNITNCSELSIRQINLCSHHGDLI